MQLSSAPRQYNLFMSTPFSTRPSSAAAAVWIDTHCHLDAGEFGGAGLDEAARAAALGVAAMVVPAVQAGDFAAVAEQNGWAGIVVHGCIRDVEEINLCNVGVRALAPMPAQRQAWRRARFTHRH